MWHLPKALPQKTIVLHFAMGNSNVDSPKINTKGIASLVYLMGILGRHTFIIFRYYIFSNIKM